MMTFVEDPTLYICFGRTPLWTTTLDVVRSEREGEEFDSWLWRVSTDMVTYL